MGRLKPKPHPLTTMVVNRMDLTTPTTEDTTVPLDNTTEDKDTTSMDTIDTMDLMDTIRTMDSTMDSTTDSATDSAMDSTTDSKPKAGNYRFMGIFLIHI